MRKTVGPRTLPAKSAEGAHGFEQIRERLSSLIKTKHMAYKHHTYTLQTVPIEAVLVYGYISELKV